MRLNKAGQYGMLLSLYLSRSGRARIEDVAENLRLSKTMLEQIARKLRKAGVVRSVRGPGGGYELAEGITVIDVFNATGVKSFLSPSESRSLQVGQTEERALANYIGAVSFHVSDLLDTKITDISQALVQQEVEQLNSLHVNATAN